MSLKVSPSAQPLENHRPRRQRKQQRKPHSTLVLTKAMRTWNLLILKRKGKQLWRSGPKRRSQKARTQRQKVFPAKTQKLRSHQGRILESNKDHRKRRSTHHKKKSEMWNCRDPVERHWQIDAERDEAAPTLGQQQWTGRYINFCIARNDIRGIETQNFSDHQNIAQQSAPDFEGERVVAGGARKDLPVLDDWWLGGHLWKERFFKRWACGTFEIWVHNV